MLERSCTEAGPHWAERDAGLSSRDDVFRGVLKAAFLKQQ